MTTEQESVFSRIAEFDKRLRRKNKHLSALKDLVVMLEKTEEEKSFAEKAAPLLKDATDARDGLSLFVRTGETVVAIPVEKSDAYGAVYEHIRSEHGFGRNILALDAGDGKAGDALSSCRREGYPACIFVPVHHGDVDMGFLCVPGGAAVMPPEDDALFLRYVGEILGVFFHHMTLKKQLSSAKHKMETQYQDLFAVYSVAKALGTNLDLATTLESGLDTILRQEVLNVLGKGGIFILNDETNCLEMACSRNLPDTLVQMEKSIPLGHCLCGIAAQTGEIILSDDCFADSRHHTHYDGMASHGHIIVPLKVKEKILGVLFLYLPPGVTATPRQIDVVRAISNQLSVSLDNARLYERVKHLSIHDPLTGLLNRNVLYERMDEELSRARRFGEVLGVAIVDIDRFKRINDQFGHASGDQVLREIAARLKKNMRGSDVVARFGGDEFVVLLTHTSREGAAIALERLRKSVTCDVAVPAGKGRPETVTLSMGVSFWTPETSLTAAQLIEEADRALYRAKEAGRNTMTVAEPGTPANG